MQTFLEMGFRPFFLAMALWAILAMLIFVLGVHGEVGVSSHFGLFGWHAHEMLFGFVGAAIAGFLLTAVPNWTGRPPLSGLPLLALLLLWIAGRTGMLWPDLAGPFAVAVMDSGFWLALAAIILVPIAAANNLRNVPIVGAVTLLFVAVAASHLTYFNALPHEMALRLGTAVIVLLIALIGGRITPNFTRNWLVQRQAERLPAEFGTFDRVVLLLSLAVLAGWVAGLAHAHLGFACLIMGILNLARQARWRPAATLGEPLLWVMHLGYAWIGLGFLMLGLSILSATVAESVAIHAWTAGAMGTMILAVATRATLGHTGRGLTAGWGTAMVYALISLATLARLAVALEPRQFVLAVDTAGAAWIAAFVLYLGLYGPALLSPRVDRSPATPPAGEQRTR